MSVINILPPHVADLIAAGEVVERPASVIKELVENSFDAGAKHITVEIRGGGSTYIRVTDDGCGMAPEDAGIAFLRHATSKLKDERGLESIGTMGFRGEALAAISSVSNIELTTRLRGSNEGTRMLLSAGEITDMSAAGCPEGTTIIIKDIFFNTPARLKFLKSDRAEASACQQAALRCALGRPDVSLRYLRDGQEEFFSPGDGRTDSVIYNLLGRELAVSMLPCSGEHTGASVEGFVSSPSAGRGNRGLQFFFCNGRFFRSQLLQTAVEQAYKNTLLTGRYPACVLYISLSAGQVDVNVHPAKTEIKFTDEKKIYDLVYYSVLSSLSREDRSAPSLPGSASVPVSAREDSAAGSVPPADTENASVSKSRESYAPAASSARGSFSSSASGGRGPVSPAAPARRDDFYRSMSASEFRSAGYTAPSPRSAGSSSARSSAASSFGGSAAVRSSTSYRPEASAQDVVAERFISPEVPDVPEQTRLDLPNTLPEEKSTNNSTENSTISDRDVENSVQNVGNLPVPDHKIVGEAMRTYIIVEVDDELILIDKHAAHERMIFDRLKTQERHISSQGLMEPALLRLSGEDASLLEANGELLGELGFEIEPYGENDFVIRAVPTDLDAGDAAAAVEEICEKLRSGSTPDPSAARDEILHTVACKAAIKAGWVTGTAELERIACAVLSGRVKYCPHGRPVSMVVTRNDLDKLFKRIV